MFEFLARLLVEILARSSLVLEGLAPLTDLGLAFWAWSGCWGGCGGWMTASALGLAAAGFLAGMALVPLAGPLGLLGLLIVRACARQAGE